MHTDRQITEWLTEKISLEETSVNDWQAIANEYPAFALAQLFLTKKMRTTEKYGEQLQKLALRFSNPLWLVSLLSDFPETEETALHPIEAEEKQEENFAENEKDNIAESRLASILDAQVADFKKPVSENEQLAFETEPAYKADYFASQGIASTEQNSEEMTSVQEKELGVKVQKFIDWLKTIKKNSLNIPEFNTTEEEEKQAAEQAVASLKTEEIITDPMAEILIAQNKKEQAIELYKKLSLLYPEKSAYFAAKIISQSE